MSNSWAEHKCKYCGRPLANHDNHSIDKCKDAADIGFAKWTMTTKRKTLNPAWLLCNKEAFEAGFRAAFEEMKNETV